MSKLSLPYDDQTIMDEMMGELELLRKYDELKNSNFPQKTFIDDDTIAKVPLIKWPSEEYELYCKELMADILLEAATIKGEHLEVEITPNNIKRNF